MQLLRISCALLVALLAMGCDKEETTPGPTETGPGSLELRQDVLSQAADTIETTYVDAETGFVALGEALEGDDLEAKRSAFVSAMDTWQRAEVMNVGPAGMAGRVAGGEDLRDQIYSWPLSNACAVDQELVAMSYESAETLRDQPVNRRGLDALEYLLFVEGFDNACDPNLSTKRLRQGMSP